MRNNKKSVLWIWIISYIIAGMIVDVITSATEFRYNMFSDDFNIIKLLLDLFIWVISFTPVYYITLSIRDKFGR